MDGRRTKSDDNSSRGLKARWAKNDGSASIFGKMRTSNQDGRQAQNRKKGGDEILIVHCCFSVSQNELKF
jgi:hypothetical protein